MVFDAIFVYYFVNHDLCGEDNFQKGGIGIGGS